MNAGGFPVLFVLREIEIFFLTQNPGFCGLLILNLKGKNICSVCGENFKPVSFEGS